jgi:hypothetical protein
MFREVLCLHIKKLMNKRAKVKREIKGQRERTFTKITQIHF